MAQVNKRAIEENNRLIARVADLTNANVDLAFKNERLRDRIWALETWQHKLDAPIATAKRLAVDIAKYHHLGQFRCNEGSDVPVGTFEGFMGIHPTDTNPGEQPENIRVNSIHFVRTWDWRKSRIPHMWWYWQNLKPERFDHEFSYPRMELMPMVVEAYDSDPPLPGPHPSGLMQQITQYRTNILEPHLVEENKLVEQTLLRWKQRVAPFLVSVSNIIEALAKIVSVEE